MNVRLVAFLSIFCLMSFSVQAGIEEAINNIDEALRIASNPKVKKLLQNAKAELISPLNNSFNLSIEKATSSLEKLKEHPDQGLWVWTTVANLAEAATSYDMMNKAKSLSDADLKRAKQTIQSTYNDFKKLNLDLSNKNIASSVGKLKKLGFN